jgi:colanic acid/amylovoran biosynthesis glycosyltransferase
VILLNTNSKKILYIGSSIPSLSETFVYREIFSLIDLGFDIHVASVHKPEKGLGEDRLNAMADSAIVIYGEGPLKTFSDCILELIKRPLRTLDTFSSGLWDAVFGEVNSLFARPKIIIQNLAAISLAKRVRELGIDHIHSHMAHVPTTIAMYCAKQLGIPFSFTGHAVDIFQYSILLRKKLNQASFVSCISEWHREFYRDLVYRNSSFYPIIRCGVDAKWFLTNKSVSNDKVEILAVGRLIEKKGFDVLIDALGMMDGKHTEMFHCSIVGDGPDRTLLEQKIKDANLIGKVELCGSKNNLEIPILMKQATIFALPSRISKSGDKDGIPVALMEAMAAGVCVVAGDLAAVRELVIDGETGVMVKPGDRQSVIDAIINLVENPEMREKIAMQGSAHVKNEFSIEVNAARIAGEFMRVNQ